MIVKKYNKETKQDSYFACYDVEQADFCFWVTDKAGARSISEDTAAKLVNYLYVNNKIGKAYKVEAINGFESKT